AGAGPDGYQHAENGRPAIPGGAEELGPEAGYPGGDDHDRGRRNQGRRGGQAGRGGLRAKTVHGGPDQGKAGRNSGAFPPPMNLHQIMTDCIVRASADVFATMLGVEIRPGEVTIESGSPDANDGVLSLIGLAGTWTGAGSIACSPAL